MKDSIKKILLLIILLVAVVAATLLVSKSQETRRGAYFDQSKIVLLGSGDLVVGEEGTVQVKAYGLKEGTKVTAFDLSFLVKGLDVLIDPSDIELESVFGIVLRKEVASLGTDSQRIWVAGYTMEGRENIPGADASGILSLFKFKIQAVEEGEGKILVDPNKAPDLAGWNPDESSIDMDVLVGEVEELAFNVGEGGLVGEGPKFNFTVRFSGINQDTEYNTESEIDVIMVDSMGKKYFYRNVPVSSTKAGNGTYKGSMILSKFPKGGENYALIKGPKHLQSKYCIDGQNGVCETAGGGLAFGDAYEEKVYNFGGWMILAGDLPDADMVQDEVVDVVDYTRLVNALPLGKRTDPEMVKRNDINGNNMVDTLDLDALLETLSTKYGALY